MRAGQLDPLSNFIPAFTSGNAWLAGDFETARWAALRGIEIEPQYSFVYINLAEADAALGRFSEAEDALRGAEAYHLPTIGEARALVLALEGRSSEAAALLRKIEPNVRGAALVRIMRAWAAVGDANQTMRCLDRIVAETPDYGRISIDLPPHPAFEKVRNDPRYLDVRRKLGRPPPENFSTEETSSVAH